MDIEMREIPTGSSQRAASASRRPACVALLLLSMALVSVSADAVEMRDLYAADVAMPEDGRLQSAFGTALEAVLVKVTGLASMGTPAARTALFPDPARLVSQYGVLPDNRVRVAFDAAAVRRGLDAAGQPVWSTQRPLVVLWYGVDAGGGERFILPAEDPLPLLQRPVMQDSLRDTLMAAARERGLPLVIPLVDAEDLQQVSFADIWGDFRERALEASSRYGAEAVLIGRARSDSPDDPRVRWTLLYANEQSSWEGGVADGPRLAAEFLAQRLATYADSTGTLRVRISSVNTLDDYGMVRNYLRSIGIVESINIVRVYGNSVDFELVVRGDANRLSQALQAGGRLEREVTMVTDPASGPPPNLAYRWTGGS